MMSIVTIGTAVLSHYEDINLEVEVGTEDTLLLDIDMISKGYNTAQIFIVNTSTDQNLTVSVRDVQCGEICYEYVDNEVSVSPGDFVEIYYTHGRRFRIYAKYPTGKYKVKIIGKVGKT